MERYEVDGAVQGLRFARGELTFAIRAARAAINSKARFTEVGSPHGSPYFLSEALVALNNHRKFNTGGKIGIFGGAAPVLHLAITNALEAGELIAPDSIKSPTVSQLTCADLRGEQLISPAFTIDLPSEQ
ncbi:MAG TPA: hypothetical protein VLF43_00625 [Candidatus Saccharimonadales bacterium]|nr:hypothetical protein [Candidatus Saccharimonadales bacterium]